jgi:AraC family transcriptional regulator, positive regulator of tynA and feaB
MKPVFSTADVHPRDRFDYWHDVASPQLVRHDSCPECRAGFHARIQTGLLSDIGLVHFENAAMAVSIAIHHAARANPGELFVCRQEAGLVTLEQDSREVLLRPGDVTLLDPARPYSGDFKGVSRMLVLKVPRHRLEARIGNTRQTTARRIVPVDGEPGLMSAFLAMLPLHAGRLGRAAEDIVTETALDLLAEAFSTTITVRQPRISSARSLTLINVRAAVEARLTDPGLDAASVAAAARVSVRYANAVLAGEGMSIMRLILARRLERCRKALEDSAQAQRSISEIAYGWGFSDMTHFGRRFRAAYGCLPRDYRAAAAKGWTFQVNVPCGPPPAV